MRFDYTKRYEVYLSIGLLHDQTSWFSPKQTGFSQEDWDSLSDAAQEREMSAMLEDWKDNIVEYGFTENSDDA